MEKTQSMCTKTKYQPAPRPETEECQRAKDSQEGDQSVQLCGAQIRFPGRAEDKLIRNI